MEIAPRERGTDRELAHHNRPVVRLGRTGDIGLGTAYSFRASFAFGRSSVLPHFRQRVARGAFRA